MLYITYSYLTYYYNNDAIGYGYLDVIMDSVLLSLGLCLSVLLFLRICT